VVRRAADRTTKRAATAHETTGTARTTEERPAMIEPKKITGTSPSSASTAVLGTAVFGLSDCDIIRVYATLQGATGGTLDVYLQTSFDGGTTWYD
jgi:hypothetical protein